MKNILVAVVLIYTLYISAAARHHMEAVPTYPEDYAVEEEVASANPLFIAVHNDDIETLQQLAANGIDLEQKNSEGKNALHIAAEDGQLDLVEFLVQNGVDINEPDDTSRTTALFSAVLNDDLEMVHYLRENGADVNAVDIDGYTPLDAAEDPKIQKYLILHGAENGADPEEFEEEEYY